MSIAHTKIAYPIRLDYVFQRPAFATFCPVDYLDVSGVPVLEGRSVAHRPPPTGYAACPYADGRFKHSRPMNWVALRNLRKVKSPVANIISSVCAEMPREFGADTQPTLLDLYRFAYICHKAPAYFALKCGAGEDAEPKIPSDYAATSRFSNGLTHLFYHVATNAPDMMADVRSAEELYRYADENRLLIGAREVCAGPPKLIVRTIEEVILALASRPRDLGGGHSSRELARTLVTFGGLCHCMEVLATVYETVRCAAWNWRNTCGDGSGADLHDADTGQPSARHAVPYCFIAREASKLPEPLSAPFICGLISCRWKLLEQHRDVLSLLESQIAGARVVCAAFRNNDPDVGEEWARFELATAEAIAAINHGLVRSLELKNAIVRFDLREFELFFGRRPFKQMRVKPSFRQNASMTSPVVR